MFGTVPHSLGLMLTGRVIFASGAEALFVSISTF
jgi:hypothetical protein